MTSLGSLIFLPYIKSMATFARMDLGGCIGSIDVNDFPWGKVIPYISLI
jgi:hypothetical protein